MDRSLLLPCLLLCACAARPEPAVVPAPPAPAADKVALLVGIDRYPADAGLGELRGAVGDAQRLRTLLIGRFGFRDEDVVLLADEAATHEAIVRTFGAQLVDRAAPGTQAVFFFAGHGSRLPALDAGGAPALDGLDTSLLAYDSRGAGRAGEYDLAEHALRALVAAAEARGAFVTVIADACHAGGVLRGPAAFRSRSAPQGRRAYDHDRARGFWPLGVPYSVGPPPAVMGSSVWIGAASRDQLAGEIDAETVFGTFEPSGALTWALCQSLDRARPGAVWGEVASSTTLGVATLLPWQDVVWSGGLDRAVFGGAYETVPGFQAVALDGEAVQVAAGWVHGLREGSELDVRTADGRASLGRATIDRITPVQAHARFGRRPPQGLGRAALRAVEVGRPAGEPPLRLWCEAPGLAPWFAGSAWAVTATSLETADLVVRSGAGGYQLWTPEGGLLPGYLPILPPTFADQGRWLALCEPSLRRESLWRATSRLALETGAIRLDVQLDAPTPEELRAPVPAGWTRWVAADPRGRRVAGGARGELPMGVFRVRNPGSDPVRLAVLNLAEDARSRRVVEPVAGREPRVLGPGEACSIRVGFPAPDPWGLDRPMLDRYLFLATLAPFDAWTLASEVDLRGDDTPLPGILRQTQARWALRGTGDIDLDRSGLGIAALDVHVSRGP
ncbi:MAG: caspase family protein [Planctomycetes bacterium]|nr:caspase family protein [Planctomycetota bacterium]